MNNRQLFLMLLMPLCILVYQNCTPVNFQDSSSLLNPKLQNGDAYGGKPEGHFYRFVPDFTCEQKSSPTAALTITDSKIILSENKKLKCGANNSQLEPYLIDSSIYQQDVIGYEEGIFENLNSPPMAIPANLVEVWCKDRDDEQGIETITHFDRQSSLAVTRIFYSDSDSVMEIPDFAVDRIASNKTVTVKAGENFDLIVHRDQPASRTGLFKAHMNVIIDGQKIQRDTACRLGGSVDPHVWPALEIVDFDVQLFKISPDGNHFAYASKTGTGINHFYSAEITGEKQKKITPALYSGISNFLFSPTSDYLVYSGDPNTTQIKELFRVQLDGSSNQQIGDKYASYLQSVRDDFRISADGKWIVYKDGIQDKSEDVEAWLRSTPASGGAPALLNPILGGNLTFSRPEKYFIAVGVPKENR